MIDFLILVGVAYMIFKDAKERKAIAGLVGAIKKKYF